MKKKIEIAAHVGLQLFVVGLLIYLLASWRPARAQGPFCTDNLNPCQGAGCTTHIDTCENNGCVSCPSGQQCCAVKWGVCTPQILGCQLKTCCDRRQDSYCIDGLCQVVSFK